MAEMRTVVRTERFEAKLILIEPCAARSDEFLLAAEWLLSRAPTEGVHIVDGVWKLGMGPHVPGVRLNLYYTFNDETVYWLWIEVAEV